MIEKTKAEKYISTWLLEHPGYLKCGPRRIAKRLDIRFGGHTSNIIQSALKMAKNAFKTPNSKSNKATKIVQDEKRVFKRLFFDIETSYNKVASWNIGQKINLGPDNILKERAIICICWKWAHENEVYSLEWDKGDDKRMLKAFMDILNEADEVIGHNGDSYDIKWIRTRCIKNNIPMFPSYQSLDTLKLSRSTFRFNSNKLDYLGQFLDIGRKMDTGGFSLWKAIVEDNDKESMATMVEYCKKDVILLENVYNRLNPYTKHKTHVGVALGENSCSCPNCGGTNIISRGFRYLSTGTKNRVMRCEDCHKGFTLSEAKFKKLEETEE